MVTMSWSCHWTASPFKSCTQILVMRPGVHIEAHAITGTWLSIISIAHTCNAKPCIQCIQHPLVSAHHPHSTTIAMLAVLQSHQGQKAITSLLLCTLLHKAAGLYYVPHSRSIPHTTGCIRILVSPQVHMYTSHKEHITWVPQMNRTELSPAPLLSRARWPATMTWGWDCMWETCAGDEAVSELHSEQTLALQHRSYRKAKVVVGTKVKDATVVSMHFNRSCLGRNNDTFSFPRSGGFDCFQIFLHDLLKSTSTTASPSWGQGIRRT